MRIGRHDRPRGDRARVFQMPHVPEVAEFPSLAREIGTDAPRAPEEGVVVDEFAGLRILPEALRLVAKRANHLGVAVEAPLPDVKVASRQLERRVGFHRGDRRDVRSDQKCRKDLEERRDDDREDGQHREGDGEPLPFPVPANGGEIGPEVARLPRRGGRRDRGGRNRAALHERRSLDDRVLVRPRARHPGAEDVVAEEEHSHDVERTAEGADPVHRQKLHGGLDEIGELETARVVEGAPHEPLREPRAVDGGHVEEHAEGREPEVRLRQFRAEEFRLEDARQEPVDHPEREKPVPAERARVDVRDDPVAIVRQRVHALHREHRPFEGRHPVRRHRDDEELEDRILHDLVPGAAQRQKTVHHAAPRRHPEHHREEHPECGSPLGKRRVVKVMRSRPDVHEDKRPEMEDGEPVGEDRAVRGFRQEVVHEAQERRREEEGDGVVAVPPLHQGVLHAGVDRVALERADRDREVVEDVEHRDRHDARDVEPNRDVEVALPAARDRSEKIHGEDDPDDGDRDVDRPLELRVLLRLREPEREGDGRAKDDQLPAPEVDAAQEIAEHPRFQQSLRGVIRPAEEGVSREGEDDGVRMERPETPKTEPRLAEIEDRIRELEGDEQPHQHPHQPPRECGDQKLSHDRVVVSERLELLVHSWLRVDECRSAGPDRPRERAMGSLTRTGKRHQACNF